MPRSPVWFLLLAGKTHLLIGTAGNSHCSDLPRGSWGTAWRFSAETATAIRRTGVELLITSARKLLITIMKAT